jgi:DNA-binding beta-propeller fold protein YncE
MKVLFSSVALVVMLAPPMFAQQSVPEIPFDSVPDFLQLPPGMNFGEVPGVAVNSKGNIFVFTRNTGAATGVPAGGPVFGATAAQLLEFTPDGKFVREIGKGLYAWAFAHSVRIDKDDNIWAVDVGSSMVVKFNQAGRVLRVFGRRQEAESARPLENPDPPLPAVDGLFRRPTDVAWDSAGNTYITDGYINSRVAKYDKDGAWVKTWGDRGKAPGQFHLPHSIAVDRNDNIYVGDRTNHRVQVFDTNGRFLRMFSIDVPPPPNTQPVYGNVPKGAAYEASIGAPQALCITPGSNQVMYVGESTFPGRLFKVTLEGKVLGVMGRAGPRLKEFSGVHGLACPSENELYTAENANWRVQKLILHPQKSQTSSAGR